MATSTQDGATGKQPAQDGADPFGAKAAGGVTKPLDIVFIQDTTGSQGPYIDSARKAIRDICDKIISSASLSPDQLRFGLIAFRDHPPQDNTYVTKQFGFTSDIKVMQKNLHGLIASGGGDGPEAQTAAIAAALDMEWKEDAVKMAVLITDAPPHGLGERGDGFEKSPDQNDPLELARQMSQQGITLFIIACEPALSQWTHAVDFYTALAQITSGRMFPLLMADKLGEYIVGTAIETIETEKLIAEFENVIVDDVYNNDKKVDDVVGNLQDFIKKKGIQVNTVVVEDVYNPSDTAMKNVFAWAGAKNLGAAQSTVERVAEPRLQAQYAPSPAAGYGYGSPFAAPTGAFRSMAGMSPFTTSSPSYSPSAPVRPGAFAFGSPAPPPPPPRGRASGASTFSFGAAPTSYAPTSDLMGFCGASPAPSASLFGAVAAPHAASPAPTPMLTKQDLSTQQAHRIVMQSMARQSKVTSEGMVNKLTGKIIPASAYASPSISSTPPPPPPPAPIV
ncbi:hypothetical protein CPB83DRAFT_809736 [Crepidotus variabilis]|uniref:VWFA domain-containing protein n=1 Tax=Crepidotus variabilis TaxID=179855 RepID=A0A9P6ELN7_9AGAR|nr:hypothetical protein CPB83DRAFT_809736 [Crepidotus variabilis]